MDLMGKSQPVRRSFICAIDQFPQLPRRAVSRF
jgi:hypothetical protein